MDIFADLDEQLLAIAEIIFVTFAAEAGYPAPVGSWETLVAAARIGGIDTPMLNAALLSARQLRSEFLIVRMSEKLAH